MMLLKYCIQYVTKFGKLRSGHRTGKGQFSFQSQRREVPKNVPKTKKAGVAAVYGVTRSCILLSD